MRKPAWVKRREADLAGAGLTEESLKVAADAYAAAGLNLARAGRRGWRVFGMHPTKPIIFLRWGELVSLVGNRERLLADHRDLCAL